MIFIVFVNAFLVNNYYEDLALKKPLKNLNKKQSKTICIKINY